MDDVPLHHLDFTDKRIIALALIGIATILLMWWVFDTLERARRDE